MHRFLKLKHFENSENVKHTWLVKCGFTSKSKTLLLCTAIPPTSFIPTIYHMLFIRVWYSLDCSHLVSFAIVSNCDFHFFFPWERITNPRTISYIDIWTDLFLFSLQMAAHNVAAMWCSASLVPDHSYHRSMTKQSNIIRAPKQKQQWRSFSTNIKHWQLRIVTFEHCSLCLPLLHVLFEARGSRQMKDEFFGL